MPLPLPYFIFTLTYLYSLFLPFPSLSLSLSLSLSPVFLSFYFSLCFYLPTYLPTYIYMYIYTNSFFVPKCFLPSFRAKNTKTIYSSTDDQSLSINFGFLKQHRFRQKLKNHQSSLKTRTSSRRSKFNPSQTQCLRSRVIMINKTKLKAHSQVQCVCSIIHCHPTTVR